MTAQRLFIGLGLPLFVALGLSGCKDADACKDHSETCVSLTLFGAEGVSQADQLQLYIQRKLKPDMPMMPLSEPQEFPLKVAVLWPDGPATLSVRSYLRGQLNGLTSELTLDLAGGAHAHRKLTLYPPLPEGPADMATPPPRDLSMPPRDLSTPPADLTTPPDDMATAVDMSMAADLSMAVDMSMVVDAATGG